MGEGLTYSTFAGVVGVTRSTLYTWEKHYPEFKQAKELGQPALELFWERLNRSAAAGKLQGANSACLIFTLKNVRGWKDKIEQEINASIPVFEVITPDGKKHRITHEKKE